MCIEGRIQEAENSRSQGGQDVTRLMCLFRESQSREIAKSNQQSATKRRHTFLNSWLLGFLNSTPLLRARHLAHVDIHLSICSPAHVNDLERSIRCSLEAFALSRRRNASRKLGNDARISTVQNPVRQRLTRPQNRTIVACGRYGKIASQIDRLAPHTLAGQVGCLIDVEEAPTRHLPWPIGLPLAHSPV